MSLCVHVDKHVTAFRDYLTWLFDTEGVLPKIMSMLGSVNAFAAVKAEIIILHVVYWYFLGLGWNNERSGDLL